MYRYAVRVFCGDVCWGVYVYRYAVRVLGGGVLLEFAGWGRC